MMLRKNVFYYCHSRPTTTTTWFFSTTTTTSSSIITRSVPCTSCILWVVMMMMMMMILTNHLQQLQIPSSSLSSSSSLLFKLVPVPGIVVVVVTALTPTTTFLLPQQHQRSSNNIMHYPCLHGQHTFLPIPTTTKSTVRTNRILHMADNSNNNNIENDMDDALSKLIGKRNQIKRQALNNNTSNSRTELMKEIEEKLANNYYNNNETTMDFDLDQLPEFQTPRIQKRPSSSSNNDNDTDNDDPKKKDIPIIDYMADYEDENDFHIPNRMILSSRDWGNVQRNFVVTSSTSTSSTKSSSTSKGKGKNHPTTTTGMMKLSKRLQKMGKFVAGDVQVAIQQCISNGILTIETSSWYGQALQSQKSSAHDIVRECMIDAMNVGLPEPILIESLQRNDLSTLRNLVFRPSISMVTQLETTLGRLGISNRGMVDMFIVPKYWGIPIRFITQALVAQIESGQTNYIGVSGITKVSTLQKLQFQLQNFDCTLSANVFPFSLTNQKYMYMIQVCKDLGIVPLIRDPLDGGLSSGVYTAMNPSGGMVTTSSSSSSKNNKFTFAQLEKLQPLHSVQETLCDRVRTRVIRNMRTIQDKYSSLSRYSDSPIRDINTDITTTQIAIQYVIAKGGVPMVSVNNPIQAEHVLGCLGWTLTDDEVAMLDSAIALCKL